MAVIHSYECLTLLDPTKTASNLDDATAQVKAVLAKYGAEILADRKWDDRKLAYPIRGHKKGYFHLTYFKMETKNLSSMDHDLRVNLKELVLRHMITVVEPKWEEEMLAVARDEQKIGAGLQLMHEETQDAGPGLDVGGPIPDLNNDDGGEGRRYRPRRSPEAEVGKE